MYIDKLDLFLGDAYQTRSDFKFSNIELRKKTLFMDDRMIICDTHIWTENDLESYVRNYYVHTQVQPFTGDTYQSRPDFKFSNI